MAGKTGAGVSRRERLEVTLTALFPASLALLGPMAAVAGRGSWLGWVCALPVGLWLCLAWSHLGKRDLPTGLTEAFGGWAGKFLQAIYLLWALALLAQSARRYAHRLLTTVQGERVQWFFLAVAFLLTVWLSRGEGETFARTGRLLFLTLAAALVFVAVLAMPGVTWKNLWPIDREELAGVPGAALLALSLSGYGVYGLCLPRRVCGREKGWPWVCLGCAVLAAVALLAVGTFGPALTAGLDEPFLLLLRRGGAALAAVVAMADLALLTLLVRGCSGLWRGLVPAWQGRGRWALALLGYVGAALAPEEAIRQAGALAPWMGLLLGAAVPTAAALLIGGEKTGGEQGTSCGKAPELEIDVAETGVLKKSCGKNAKKC